MHKLKQIPLHNVFKVKIGHFGAGKKSELPSVSALEMDRVTDKEIKFVVG